MSAILVAWACGAPPTVPDRGRASINQDAEPGGFVSLVASEDHGCALHASGRVLCWGDNAHGQLGTGDFQTRHEPEVVAGIADAVAITVGAHHSCALHRTGRVSCWGLSDRVGHASDGRHSRGDTARPVPVRAPGGSLAVGGQVRAWCPDDGVLEDIVSIDAGQDHTCAVHASGSVLCWGSNAFQHVGVAHRNLSTLSCPMPVEGVQGATRVVAGTARTCAETEGKTFVCWGWGMEPAYDLHLFQPGPNANRWAGMAAITAFEGAEDLQVGGVHHCARWPEGTTTCRFELLDREADWVDVDEVVSFSPGSRELCFLHPGGRRSCLGVQEPTRSPEAIWEGVENLSVVAIPVNADVACGLTHEGSLLCSRGEPSHEGHPLFREVVLPEPEGAPPERAEADATVTPECPRDLVFGDAAWPNHLRFERNGMSRTFYFERTTAEFVQSAEGQTHVVILHFPDLRFDTSDAEAPRVDGWSGMTLYGPLKPPGESWSMSLGFEQLHQKLGCFTLPPLRFGSVAYTDLAWPEEGAPTVGGVAGVFETTTGGSETGRITGAFQTEEVVREVHFPIDPSRNASVGYATAASHPDPERVVGTQGRAYHRAHERSLLLQFTDGTTVHGRHLSDFRDEEGVYIVEDRLLQRFHVRHVDQGRVAGAMDAFDGSLQEGPLYFLEQLFDLSLEPTAHLQFHFDLPLLRVLHPGEMHHVDRAASLRRAASLVLDQDAITTLAGTHRFDVYQPQDPYGLPTDPREDALQVLVADTPEGLSWRVERESAPSREVITASAEERLVATHTTDRVGSLRVSTQQEGDHVVARAMEEEGREVRVRLSEVAPWFHDLDQLLVLIPRLHLEPSTLYPMRVLRMHEHRGRVVPTVHEKDLAMMGTETVHFRGETREAQRIDLTRRDRPDLRWRFYLSLDAPTRLVAAVGPYGYVYLPADE